MAKRASRLESSDSQGERTGTGVVAGAEHRIEEFAEDLGRLLGTARAKAEGWIGQRQTVAKHLEEIRDTAAELLKKIGGGGWVSSRGATDGDGVRRPGRPRKAAVTEVPAVATPEPKKKRTMSAAARQAISNAQKARWAKQKRARKVE
ncbi:MAG: hypothetical protein GEU82_04120 [Luteitalea sp.]|nr:hypothetical protein [Luteitalea sp.]